MTRWLQAALISTVITLTQGMLPEDEYLPITNTKTAVYEADGTVEISHTFTERDTAVNVLYILDSSGSMGSNFRGGQSRLEGMKTAVCDSIDRIAKERRGSRFGVIYFGDSVTINDSTILHFTDDTDEAKEYVMNHALDSEDDYEVAFEYAKKMLDEESTPRPTYIYFITDESAPEGLIEMPMTSIVIDGATTFKELDELMPASGYLEERVASNCKILIDEDHPIEVDGKRYTVKETLPESIEIQGRTIRYYLPEGVGTLVYSIEPGEEAKGLQTESVLKYDNGSQQEYTMPELKEEEAEIGYEIESDTPETKMISRENEEIRYTIRASDIKRNGKAAQEVTLGEGMHLEVEIPDNTIYEGAWKEESGRLIIDLPKTQTSEDEYVFTLKVDEESELDDVTVRLYSTGEEIGHITHQIERSGEEEEAKVSEDEAGMPWKGILGVLCALTGCFVWKKARKKG